MWRCPPAKILVAVDFGEASARAVALAGALAARFDARLTAIHAETAEVPVYFTHEQLNRIEAEVRASRRIGIKFLRQFVARYTTVHADTDLVDAPPADGVLKAAAGSDMLVMGTHGRRGPGRWWMGSVAERVVAASEVPVLVARASTELPVDAIFKRPVVLASGQHHPGLDAWKDALQAHFDAEVHDGAGPEECDLEAVQRASLLLVPLCQPAAPRAAGLIVARLIRGCEAPVLFVPTSTDGCSDDPGRAGAAANAAGGVGTFR